MINDPVHRPNNLQNCPELVIFQNQQRLNHFCDDLYKINWYTHISGERSSLKDTIGYIGRYSKRPAISEAKIVQYKPNQDKPQKSTITFEYNDHKSKSTIQHTCTVFQFITKLIQHIPQKYFHVIRSYGLIANRIRKKFIFILRQLFGFFDQIKQKLFWRQRQKIFSGEDPLVCPVCKTIMTLTFRQVFDKSQYKVITV